MDRSFRPSSPAYAAGPLAFILGVGLGAALMFFLDPESGRRRRVARHRLHSDEIEEDGVLLERVRAALGHVVGDPHAVDIRVKCGIVVLKGPARQEQMDELLACARNVRGVLDVENRLSLSLDGA